MQIIEKLRLRAALASAFSPSAPVRRIDLFSGRQSELDRLTEAVFQRGQHAAIYGERGVGKTSLANVLPEQFEYLNRFDYQVVRYSCSAVTTFNSIWDGILRELTFKRNIASSDSPPAPVPMNSYLPENASPEDVRFLLQQTGTPVVAVIDEFECIPKDGTVSSLLAGTIKSLSDHAVDATLIIVGVADSIDELIAEHRSVQRALVQIQMPRMTEKELLSVVEKGFQQAAMEIDLEAREQISALSQGLPHNAHDLGLRTGYACLEAGRLRAAKGDVELAIKQSVENAQQSMASSYCKAVDSPHENIYKEILLAAALASANELGYFSAGELRKPLAIITGRDYGIDAYMKHLNSFCEESRGKLLERRGERRRYRFRFSDPIMEPYVILRGIAEGLISKDGAVELESENFKANSPSLF